MIKLILSIILVLLGTGAVGLTLGLAFNHILSSTLLGIVVLTTIFKSSEANILSINFVRNSKKILHSSIVYWIPFLITIIGSQLGDDCSIRISGI